MEYGKYSLYVIVIVLFIQEGESFLQGLYCNADNCYEGTTQIF